MNGREPYEAKLLVPSLRECNASKRRMSLHIFSICNAPLCGRYKGFPMSRASGAHDSWADAVLASRTAIHMR